MKQLSHKSITSYGLLNLSSYHTILIYFIACIIGITIFQDFLESIRNGYSFYISESILFKTIWILFIPFLIVLEQKLKNQKLESLLKTAIYIVTPIIIHVLLLSVVFTILSLLFYDGRYNFYKILSYTLSNDISKLVLVYSVFILLYKYNFRQFRGNNETKLKSYINRITVRNGNQNTVIETEQIYHMTADSPYVAIHLKSSKYLHRQTLKSILNQLNPEKFIRIHKSTIINLDKIQSVESRYNGDYNIILVNGTMVRLSRTFVSNFKTKFEHSNRITF